MKRTYRKVYGRNRWKGRAATRKKYPLVFPLSEMKLEVLDGIARYGPINPNKLRGKIKKAYSFIFNTLKELEMRRMVTFQKVKNEKGTYSKIYDLDLEGVLKVLHRPIFKDHGLACQIMSKHSAKLPLVFGKFDYFMKSGLGELAFVRLWYLLSQHEGNPFRRGTGIYYWLEPEQQMTRFFFLFDFYRLDDNPIPGFNFKTWLATIHADEEIRKFVIQELEYDLKTAKNQQNILETVLSFMQKPLENSKSA